jgi:hypothetical protein
MTVAMKDCANYEIVLELGADIPHIVRTEAMQIGRLTRRLEPSVASSPDAREGNQDSDVVSTVQQDAKEGEPAGKGSLPVESADGSHGSVDSAIDSVDSRPNLFDVQRTFSMSRSNGIDPTRLRQLRAITDNLCTLARRHRENKNYVVAHALYGRALAVAQEIHTPDDDGSSLVARIREDQQTVFDLMRSGESPEKPPLEKAKEVGR